MKSSKNIRKIAVRLFAGVIASLMIVSPVVSFASGASDAVEEEYVPYTAEAETDAYDPAYAMVMPINSAASVGTSQFGGGHIYVPYDLPEYERNPLEPASAEASQPFYFALGEGVGTYCKDQGNYGTCWAFSVTGAAESSLIAQGRTFNKGTPATASNIDLSELHTAYFFYNTETDPLGNMQNDRSAIVDYTYLTGGGNNMFTGFALMAWKGMALESTCPYSSITGPYHPVDQSLAHKEAAHCRNMYWINMNDIGLVKEMIVKYGGVVVSYNHNYLCYSDMYKSFYDPHANDYGAGHSVMIVGWDDNHDKNQYFIRPDYNGAWIVKNSWGQNWGMQSPGAKGTYWMSYQDATLRRDIGLVLDYEDADNFDNNYQYDGTAGIGSLSIPASKSDPTKLGNQFVVKASDYERLSAVAVAFESNNVNYSIQVYKKNNSSGMRTAPDQGTPMLDKPVTGKTSLTGYYTIPLNQELVFKKGEMYSIVISIWHDTGNASVFTDQYFDNYWCNFVNDTEYGQSWFAWGQNAGWAELSKYIFPLDTGYRNGYTLRIKGYTDNVAPINFDVTGLSVEGDGYARLGHSYSATLIKEKTFPETIDVFMSGVLLTEGTSYTYDNTTGEIRINKVNGPVDISAYVDTHEHVWDDGVVTAAPTCGAVGIKTYTCTECGETRTEEVPATGRHTWDAGVVTTAPTRESTGVMTYTCTVCGAVKTEEIPMLPDEITVEKTGSYNIKISGLDATRSYIIRYATGVYSSISALKNGANAGFIRVGNAYDAVVTLPTDGVHTISVQEGSDPVFFGQISIDKADLRDHLVASSNELNLRVENLVGASYVKLYRNGAAVLTFAAKNFSSDGLKTWADIAVPSEGSYIVRIVYADGGIVEGNVTLTAASADVAVNGRVFTVSGFGGNGRISFMRLAKGTYTTANAIKAASDLRTYGAKYFKGDSAAFAALDAAAGETTVYTVQIGYASGRSQFITFEVTPTVPVLTVGERSLTIENAEDIDWIRCAPGKLSSLYAIRHSFGSQVKKAADAANGKITFTGLTKGGTYTLYYLYNSANLSEGIVTVTLK